MKEYNTDKNSVKEYFDNLKELIGEENLKDLLFEQKQVQDGIFLSVIMRTQGKRIEMMREALLCLEAQTCNNFEVWVLGHNVADSDRENVINVINDFTDEFRSRIFYEDVIGGTRTTPLNYGFEKSNGQYIAIFDDDDLLFDNWVETFYDLYKENPGKILHTYAVGQEWKMVDGIPVSTSAFNNVYCRDFIMQNQLVYNNCPIMSLAFPAYAYKKLGIKFNEQLNTTEDWDFLMRTSFVCGVCDSKTVTSIYRFWKNVQNSQTLHNEDEWTENCKKIQKGFQNFLIPVSVKQLNSGAGNLPMHPLMGTDSLNIEVFIDNGKGFTAEGTAKFKSGFFGENIKVTISDPERFGVIKAIRFDPCELGVLQVSNLSVDVIDKNNKKVKTKIDFLNSNFVKCKKSFVFIDIDPQVRFKLKKPAECSNISLVFRVTKQLSWRTLCATSTKFFFMKVIRKIVQKFFNLRGKLGV